MLPVPVTRFSRFVSFALLLLGSDQGNASPPEPVPPESHRWTMAEFGGVLSVGLEGHRSFAAGKALFTSAKCANCHRFGSLGKGVAPDLLRLSRTNTPEDFLEPILSAQAHLKGKTALTDNLSQEQILDLLAFLLSGGDPNSSLFQGSR